MILSALGVVGTTFAYIFGRKFDNNTLDDLHVQKEKINELATQQRSKKNSEFGSSINVNAKQQAPEFNNLRQKLTTGSADDIRTSL